MIIRPLGYKEDPPDPRDVMYGAGASVGVTSLPNAFSLLHLLAAVGPLWQTTSESCVIQVAATCCRIVWEDRYGMGKATPVPSRRAAYYIARATVGEQHENVGTYPRLSFPALNKAGWTTEDILPFDEDKILDPLPAHVYRTMVDQENMLQYKRIVDGGSGVEEIKHSIAASKRPVGVALPVVGSFDNYTNGIFNPKGDAAARGWHYCTIIGYDDDLQAFLCSNSWQGHGIQEAGLSLFWISYESVANVCRDKYALFPSKLPSHLNQNQGL